MSMEVGSLDIEGRRFRLPQDTLKVDVQVLRCNRCSEPEGTG